MSIVTDCGEKREIVSESEDRERKIKKKTYNPLRDENLKGKLVPVSFSEEYLGKDLAAHSTYEMAEYEGVIHIDIVSASVQACCTKCGQLSAAQHGCANRNPQMKPINGKPVIAHMQLFRYTCTNPECSQGTFVEEFEKFSPCKHNSDDVFIVIFAISVFCSSTATAYIVGELGIEISHDTVRNLINSVAFEDDPDIEEIGVDDVSVRKGQTYNTVIYRIDNHQLIAVLEGRDGKALEEWLKNHPKVKKVARDRASAYAAAIAKILPECMQIADRFHLLKNLLERLNEIFKEEMPSTIYIRGKEVLDEAPKKITVSKTVKNPEAFEDVSVDNSAPVDAEGNVIEVNSKEMHPTGRMREQQAAARKKKHDKVVAIRREMEQAKAEGRKLTKNNLAAKYDICVQTVSKWLNMPETEVEKLTEINPHNRHSAVDGYENIIFKLMQEGRSPVFIKSYLMHIGCPATEYAVEEKIKHIARNHFGKVLARNTFREEVLPPDVIAVSRFDVLKYLSTDDKDKKDGLISKEIYEIIREHYPVVVRCEEVWNAFHSLLMGDTPEGLDNFIEKYDTECNKPVEEEVKKDRFQEEIGAFVNGLKMDIDAVKNAITEDISSGFVEGGNCRYKLIKRIMYGRAKLFHLNQRCLVASLLGKTDTTPADVVRQILGKVAKY